MDITGKTLIEWGFQPGHWFAEGIKTAQAIADAGGTDLEIRTAVARIQPPADVPLNRAGAIEHFMNIEPEGDHEIANVASVNQHMIELMRLPTVRAGAVMPDACPSGHAPGTIPVGGVIATENAIHPGMHSADICCSMAVSVFKGAADPTAILDAGMRLSHFGGGGRPRGAQVHPPTEVMKAFAENAMLAPLMSAAIEHFATQGDGNHFFYVGRVRSTGDIALVTHHGSRKPGAMLYKAGMAAAERFRQRLSPETARHNAWIPADTREGEAYWSALQTIRAWTKASHFAIHDMVASSLGLGIGDRFWNEHNFVFRKTDGLFYHAKGATPAYRGYASDDIGLTLIPLNMAQSILIASGLDAANGLGFAPHGAGRNFSRTAYLHSLEGRSAAEIMSEQAPGIDVRSFCGIPDLSELPGAYKDAASVRRQISQYGLADVVETIEPIGSIMAGDWQQDAPWRKTRGAARNSIPDSVEG